jgi:5-methyltetrahydrofolate--homocysteine methyltransferase
MGLSGSAIPKSASSLVSLISQFRAAMLDSRDCRGGHSMPDLHQLYSAILNGEEKLAFQLAEQALSQGESPADLISRWMIPAMDEVGRLFEAQEYFIPELLLAGRAMKAALEPLRPLLAASGAQPTGRVVIGTVKGDLHDIGKNLVASMLEGAGFEVFDLGIDVPAEKFVEAVRTRNPDIVALSALLSVTMPEMKKTIDALNLAGIRGQVKILVGGAPVTRDYAESVGADGYGDNASSAVTLARSLLGK